MASTRTSEARRRTPQLRHESFQRRPVVQGLVIKGPVGQERGLRSSSPSPRDAIRKADQGLPQQERPFPARNIRTPPSPSQFVISQAVRLLNG